MMEFLKPKDPFLVHFQGYVKLKYKMFIFFTFKLFYNTLFMLLEIYEKPSLLTTWTRRDKKSNKNRYNLLRVNGV